MRIRKALVAIVWIIALTPHAIAKPRIVTSIYPLRSIVEAIGGDRVTVTSLVPRGADPHNFELTPSSAIALEKADLIFLIGGGFDTWSIGLQKADDARSIQLYQSFTDSLIPLGNGFNPHIWLDPLMAEQIAKVVALKLEQVSPSDSTTFRSRLRNFVARIDSLNHWVSRTLTEAKIDEFVSLHPAWSYFARRYGLKEVATIEISDEHEPSARHVAEVIRMLRRMKKPCIIAEEFSNPGLAESVASMTNAKIVMLDPLGGSHLGERSSYVGLIRYNVEKLREACSN